MPSLSKKKEEKVPLDVHAGKIKSDKSRGFVYIEKGVTIKTGEYESARVSIGINAPIGASAEEMDKIEKTMEFVDGLVSEELEFQIEEITK